LIGPAVCPAANPVIKNAPAARRLRNPQAAARRKVRDMIDSV
jgi:hypothetical protein